MKIVAAEWDALWAQAQLRFARFSQQGIPPFQKEHISKWYSYVEIHEECWVWKGGITKAGYGNFRVVYAQVKAHRMSWFIHKGPISAGLFVCHTCDVKHCVNPDHLFLGTGKQNMEDCTQKRRQCYGIRCHSAKLTPEMVRSLRSRFTGARGEVSQMARELGMDYSTIKEAISGSTWKQV